uniref:Protein kinase domain-containing protein n=1 Tax=Oryza rufipogon TaxID=4529 RepID=A0A0E0RBU7_ORYRU
MAVWGGLGQAATVAQLVGADVGGLITMIMKAAMTAQQNKKECEQLARRVFTIAELLQHLQDPEVLRRPEIRRPLTGLDDTLREAHELVLSCQDKSAVYQLVMAGRQDDRFRDAQSRIDSYLLLFPVISHMDITRRLDRIYNILLPNDMARPSMSPISMPPNPVPAAQASRRTRGGHQTHGREILRKENIYIMRELSILRSISHQHIIRVFGSCAKEKRQLLPPFRKKQEETLLVLEYMENGSLDSHLHGPPSSSPVMTAWRTRIEILLGVSRAIEYMQSYGERPVIHRDIKPANILLDASWAPRLSDFLLALTEEGEVIGTLGYMDPEYAMTGILNLMTDIYSFGVVMLEVLTGKKPYFSKEEWEEMEKTEECVEEEKREEREQEGKNTGEDKEESEREEEEKTTEESPPEWLKLNQYDFGGHYGLVSFALPLIEAGKLWKVLDRRPAAEPTARQLEAAELVAQTAARCLRLRWEERPAISEVVANLEKALELARCDGNKEQNPDLSAIALWDVTGHAATVAQLVGADVGGLISMIMQAAMTAQQNKKECEQLARRVFTIAELLQHLQDPEDKSAVYRLVMAGRQAERFREVQSRIDSYLLVSPFISHIDITRRLDRIYNILLPTNTPGPSTPAFPVPPNPVPAAQEKRQLLPPFRKKLEEILLVLEYMENGSLNSHLHGPRSSSPVITSWKMHIEILLGVSRAIEYLQSYAERPVIHRDIKTSNILLDISWAPHLTDFELALTWEGPDHVVDLLVQGTLGYLAPECIIDGTLNPTVDVYSLGVVMLEVLTGKKPYFSEEWKEKKTEECVEEEKREECDQQERKNTEEDKEESEEDGKTTKQRWYEWLEQDGIGHQSLVSLALILIEAGELWKFLDRRPAPEPTPRQLEAAELVAQIADRCLRLQWEERPAISEVVANLEKALELARCDG